MLNRTQGPVNTPNIQSHGPVSPAGLLKHLVKLTLFLQCQQPENEPSGTATALYALWKRKVGEAEGERGRGKQWKEGGGYDFVQWKWRPCSSPPPVCFMKGLIEGRSSPTQSYSTKQLLRPPDAAV